MKNEEKNVEIISGKIQQSEDTVHVTESQVMDLLNPTIVEKINPDMQVKS